MPPYFKEIEKARPFFNKLKRFKEFLKNNYGLEKINELSWEPVGILK